MVTLPSQLTSPSMAEGLGALGGLRGPGGLGGGGAGERMEPLFGAQSVRPAEGPPTSRAKLKESSPPSADSPRRPRRPARSSGRVYRRAVAGWPRHYRSEYLAASLEGRGRSAAGRLRVQPAGQARGVSALRHEGGGRRRVSHRPSDAGRRAARGARSLCGPARDQNSAQRRDRPRAERTDHAGRSLPGRELLMERRGRALWETRCR